MNARAEVKTSQASDRVVLIAQDHALVRHGVAALIAAIMGAARIVEVNDAAALVGAAQAHPNAILALVDLGIPGMRQELYLDELARIHNSLPLVVITATAAPDMIRRVLEVPTVHALIPRYGSVACACEAIEAALKGRKLPRIQDLPVQHKPRMTRRLVEVHRLLRLGMSNKEIAQTMGIAEGSTKNYVSHLMQVLGVRNRVQAANIDLNAIDTNLAKAKSL
jgi:DNA-binding NarL/FixJ family response regulator